MKSPLITVIRLAALPSLLLAAVFATGGAFAQEAQFDADATLRASLILPPELASGPNHHVQERVVNDGYLNIYRIESPWGELRAASTTQLRQYVHELNAVARMDLLSNSDEFKRGIKGKAGDVLSGAKNVVVHPVDTISGAVSGVGAAFGRVGEAVTSRTQGAGEDSRLKNAIGYSKTKRDYAYEFNVDVYSRNQILQDRLNELSWAEYGGSLTTSALVMAIPGVGGAVVSATGGTELMNKVYRDMPPNELRKRSRAKLKAMGASSDVLDLYLKNEVFTPREQNDIVEALDAMAGTANRIEFIKFAVLTENPDLAAFRQRQAEMYLSYHRKVSPIARFVPFGRTIAAVTKDGTVVFNASLDYLRWTPQTSDFAIRVTSIADGIPGVRAKHLWIEGSASPLARKNLESSGWKVFEGAQAKPTGGG